MSPNILLSIHADVIIYGVIFTNKCYIMTINCDKWASKRDFVHDSRFSHTIIYLKQITNEQEDGELGHT